MEKEHFRWVAGLIAAHPDRKVVGRTRVQKTVYLLQRKGFPTALSYSLHFYGPYSTGLNSELRVVEQLGLVKEERIERQQDSEYYVFRASPEAELPEMAPWLPILAPIRDAGDIPLELATTYDAFREMGYSKVQAMERLRMKKGDKCTPENVEGAMSLLRQLGLLAET
jgi:uncharacterized protein